MPPSLKGNILGRVGQGSAPEVYRPQRSVQLRSAATGDNPAIPSAPPVYRPERLLQMRTAAASGPAALSSVPPVYRPVPPAATHATAPLRTAPPVYRLGVPAQRKAALPPPLRAVAPVLNAVPVFRPVIQPSSAPGSFCARISIQPRQVGFTGSGTIQRTAPFRAHVHLDVSVEDQSGLRIGHVLIEGRPSVASADRKKGGKGKDVGHADDWNPLKRVVELEFANKTVKEAAEALGQDLKRPVAMTVAAVEVAIKDYAKQRHENRKKDLTAENSTSNRSRGATGAAIEQLYLTEKDPVKKSNLLGEMFAVGSVKYSPEYRKEFATLYGSVPPAYEKIDPRETSPDRYKGLRKDDKRIKASTQKRKREEEVSSSKQKRKREEEVSSTTTTTTTITGLSSSTL